MRQRTTHATPRVLRIRARRALLAMCVGAAASLPVVGASSAGASLPAPASGWTTVWADDFAGASGTKVDSANWIYDIGTSYPGGAPKWGTGEVETMTDSTSNVYQDGAGNLRIRALRDRAGRWTSGRIETQRTDFRPGPGQVLAFEARIQLPNLTGSAAQGYWPAFWMLGAPFRGNYQNWPGIGELDAMENINGVNTVYGTLHCGTSPGGPCNETNGIGNSRTGFSPTLQQAFHTYRVEWDRSASPETVRWYVDGVQFHSVNASQFDATTWSNAFDHGYFIILNVAIGGGWPGSPTRATASGGEMVVDYVTVQTLG